ncbi:pentatricopeptide repeat-containing protein At4g18975, chloroplastic-like [Diospyros lotus]|uniref:pentatricopeptide repeat-containing protein At4g18975, chloroplastic-like n=1 Tax=Diospyros lotus TaxID=55363 RepID=UPI00224EC7DE|nr:pentatricopeptide repeat-containing protein At4g18975, chloroplastic-like [Diospyros lotus]
MAALVGRITQIVRVRCLRYSYHTSVQTPILNWSHGNAMVSPDNHHGKQAMTLGSTGVINLVSHSPQLGFKTQSYSMMAHVPGPNKSYASSVALLEDEKKSTHQLTGKDPAVHKHQIGENVPRKDKVNFLYDTLHNLKDSKEAVYGALDAWVAWEQNFPIGSLRQTLLTLEKEQQWHKVIQVIKWMLSKGQGNTMGTYGQLIRALDMDHRAEEAHEFWARKIGSDLHAVPWQLCHLMISVYYRNNMLENLVKLFKGLEAFDRKPPEKAVVQKVANAYEMLGLMDERDRVLDKYKSLFSETRRPNKSRKLPKKRKRGG